MISDFLTGLAGDWTATTLALIAATFMLAGFVKGLLGLGLPIVVIAMLATTLGLKPALALMVVPGVVTNIWQALAGPAFLEIVRRLWSLLALAVAGIFIGVGVLAGSDAKLITALVGVVLATYAVLSLYRPRLPPPKRAEAWLSPAMGGAAGFMFGLTGTFMVPGVLYIEALGMKRDAFVQSLGITFVVITATLAIALHNHSLLDARLGITSVASLVPMAIGMVAGQMMRKRVPEAQFRRMFFIGLLISGVYIVVRAFV